MVHPFTNAVAYPWACQEAHQLYEVLVRDVTDFARIDVLVKRAAPGLAPLNRAEAPAVVWKNALEQIAAAGTLHALCQILHDEPEIPGVSQAAKAVLDMRPAVAKRISHDGRITADRVRLRLLIELLSQEDGSVKVLVVRGGPKTGKTWSRHLFEQAARENGADVTYIFDGTAGSVRWVIDKLFSALQASDRIPPEDTSPHAWYRSVFNRLMEAAARRGRPLWVAVDDLGPGPDGVPRLDTEIRAFFDQLALHLLDPAMHRWFRLLLIHYPEGPLPTKWERELWEEDRTDAGDVQADDIISVLHEWASDHHKQLLETEATRLAGEVIAVADSPRDTARAGTPRLRRIQDELTAVLRNLGGQAPWQ